jgi:hypothetical protein
MVLTHSNWHPRAHDPVRCGAALLGLPLLTLAITAIGSSAAGQTLSEQPPLGSTLNLDFLQDLPIANNPLALLETIQPEAIADRFSSGGLNAASAPRFGTFLNSWTQTQFRIGDVTITDPRAGGTPLLLPVLPMWERMTTVTGAMVSEENAPGLSMTLQPRRPGTTWVRTVEGSISGSALVADSTNPVPVVDGVRQWIDGDALVSGPLSDRLGLVAAGSWRRLSHVAVPNTIETSDRVASGFSHLVFAATPRDEVRVLGWAQRVKPAGGTDTGVHVQSTWEHRDPTGLDWRVFGGYTHRSRATPVTPTLVVDSLDSDPVSDLIDPGAGTARRWALGARASSKARRIISSAGLDLESSRIRIAPTGLGQIREFVDGVPARLWTLHAGPGNDVRHLMTFAAYGNERLTYRRLTLDAGLRFEVLTGAADRSARGIDWTTWLPSTKLRWQIADAAGLAAVASYRRSAYQLPLNVLAIGDPAAPVADVALWNGASPGSLIARVGPGTGGDATFTQIDPKLERPVTDELVLAVESRPIRWLQIQLARVTKHEEPLLDVVNTGVPSSAYTAIQVPDPGFLPFHSFGAPQVTVYNRPPASYGRDLYFLTNPADNYSRFWGLQLTVRVSADRFTLLAGGSLTEAVGPAAAVGFLPTENDQDVLGNSFVDPNAAIHERGQLFQDRSHVVKLAAVYRFRHDIRLGVAARYQDGQPFARLLIVPNLTQGSTAVRAYENGGSAFTYTGTLDIRVQKVFTTGGSQVAASVDVYNLPNLGKEVAEYVVTGDKFRAPTARQPARTVLAGVRVTF